MVVIEGILTRFSACMVEIGGILRLSASAHNNVNKALSINIV